MAHILFVEDDPDVQAVVSEYLGTMGYRVTAVASAEEARLTLAMQRVDLALIDCLMSGEQGNSLAEHASQLGIATILTSGDPHYIDSFANRSFPFLAKPFRLSCLDRLIANTLDSCK
jgi:DNA-binding NtrC family response regulator